MQYTTTTTVLHNAHITSARNDQVYPFFILLIYSTFIGPTTVQTIIGPTNQITVRLQKNHKIYTYSRKYCLQSVSTLLYQGLTSTTCIYIFIYTHTYTRKWKKQLYIWKNNWHVSETCMNNPRKKWKPIINAKLLQMYQTTLIYSTHNLWWGTSQCNDKHWNKQAQVKIALKTHTLGYWNQRVLLFCSTLLFPSDHVYSLLLFLHASNLVSAEVILIVKTSWTFLIQISRFVKGPLREQAISHFGP